MEKASLSTRSPTQRACKIWENGTTSQIPDCRIFDGSSAETFAASFRSFKRPVSFSASVIPLILVSLRERTFKTCWVALPTCSMPCSNWPSMFLMFSRLKRFSRDSCKAPDWYLRTKDVIPLLVAGSWCCTKVPKPESLKFQKPLLLRCWVYESISCIHVYFYVHVFRKTTVRKFFDPSIFTYSPQGLSSLSCCACFSFFWFFFKISRDSRTAARWSLVKLQIFLCSASGASHIKIGSPFT